MLSIPNLKALLYSIRNLFDLDVLKCKVVNPSYLLSRTAGNYWFSSEHKEWSLENEDVFYKFHKILLPFNYQKSKFELNLKNKKKLTK